MHGERESSGRLSVVGGRARVDGRVVSDRDARNDETWTDSCPPRPHTHRPAGEPSITLTGGHSNLT